ncbi:hypothetical protein, partial [Escherichia coli]|uniref:hypothetical protein n=1 Tax=Escherichia coli TaxID=562 RepID=UPI00214FA10D
LRMNMMISYQELVRTFPNFIQLDHPVQISILKRALFKLRQKCGNSLAEIAVTYGLDVDDELAIIIPFNNPSNI